MDVIIGLSSGDIGPVCLPNLLSAVHQPHGVERQSTNLPNWFFGGHESDWGRAFVFIPVNGSKICRKSPSELWILATYIMIGREFSWFQSPNVELWPMWSTGSAWLSNRNSIFTHSAACFNSKSDQFQVNNIINQSIKHSANQSISQSMNQPMNQSINQAISLSDYQNNTAMFHSSRNSRKHADAILRHMSHMCFLNYLFKFRIH